MRNALEWLAAHPELCKVILWPILTAILTLLFKPRTPEEYAAMNPRVAALLKFTGAIGFDAPKVVEALGQLVTGRSKNIITLPEGATKDAKK